MENDNDEEVIFDAVKRLAVEMTTAEDDGGDQSKRRSKSVRHKNAKYNIR